MRTEEAISGSANNRSKSTRIAINRTARSQYTGVYQGSMFLSGALSLTVAMGKLSMYARNRIISLRNSGKKIMSISSIIKEEGIQASRSAVFEAIQ